MDYIYCPVPWRAMLYYAMPCQGVWCGVWYGLVSYDIVDGGYYYIYYVISIL